MVDAQVKSERELEGCLIACCRNSYRELVVEGASEEYSSEVCQAMVYTDSDPESPSSISRTPIRKHNLVS